MTKIVNFIGGPGSGKSTFSYRLMAHFKMNGISCEYTGEYAKEKVWDDHLKIFDNQLLVFAQQQHRLHRLVGKVDYIITDSPLVQFVYYLDEFTPDEEKKSERFLAFKKLIWAEFNSFTNINFFMKRPLEFNNEGRYQDSQKALKIDNEMMEILTMGGVPFSLLFCESSQLEDILNYIQAVE
jgi:hypothetical protein